MANYGFIGNQRFGNRTAGSIVVENLSYWMNISFLEQGAYTNISKNQLDYWGNDSSQLSQINDGSWVDGGIYQSRFKNWVYESGVTIPAGMSEATICSGVWIGGDFYNKDTASGDLAFTVDYINGRVKFFTPYGPAGVYGSGSVPIKAEFSYKDIYISSDENMPSEAVVVQSMSNPAGSGVSYPTEKEVPFPVVIVGEKNSSWRPKQLGGFKIGVHSINCNVYADNKTDRNGICDVLAQQENKKVPTIDWSKSETPLDEYGDINASFSGVYDAKTAYPSKDMYILSATASKDSDKFTEGVVFYQVETDSYI